METHKAEQQELPFDEELPPALATTPPLAPVSFPPIIGTAVIVVPLY